MISILSNLFPDPGIDKDVLECVDLQDDLGMDSITFVQIIVALEEEFECEIPDSKLLITEMNTIQKIVEVLKTIQMVGENN